MSIQKEFLGANSNDDEINLKLLFLSLKRQKKIVIFFTSIFLLVGGIYAFTARRIWKGDLQIVLSQDTNVNSNNLGNLLGGSGGPVQNILRNRVNSKLSTEVEILKSPSVLMPTFEFFKENTKNKKSIDSLVYLDWISSNFNVELQKGTAILNVSYFDSDREIIIPILNEISKSYQNYSGKKRNRQIQLGLKFLENQIASYKVKSKKSLIKAQEFASEYDLGFSLKPIMVNSTFITTKNNQFKNDLDTTDLEKVRVNANNRISSINEKLKRLKDEIVLNKEISFFSGFSSEFSNDPIAKVILKNLSQNESELAINKIIFKESDPVIVNLKDTKESLKESFKRQLIDFLIAKKNEASAISSAAERPEGVMRNYQQLLIDAQRDQNTLSNLETEYRAISLEKFRIKDPWELITKPTLGDLPVAPRKRNILSFSLILGFLTGSIAAVSYEKYKNLIYSIEEINNHVKFPIVGDLRNNTNNKSINNSIELLMKGPLSNLNDSLALITIDDIPPERINSITNKIQSLPNKINLMVASDINANIQDHALVILVSIGLSKRSNLIEINKKLTIQKNKVIGILLM